MKQSCLVILVAALFALVGCDPADDDDVAGDDDVADDDDDNGDDDDDMGDDDDIGDDDTAECDINVPGDASTIQEAIDSAVSGDLVCVGPGTYTENLTFLEPGVGLLGVDGASATILDGGGVESVVTVESKVEETSIRGVTLTHGAVHGGIYLRNNADLTLQYAVVTDNDSVGSGGGISGSEANHITLRHVSLTDNSADNHGGGISVGTASRLEASDIIVSGNSAGSRGGGGDSPEAGVEIHNGLISGNTADSGGGGWNGLADLTNVLVVGNSGTGLREPSELINVVVASNDGTGVQLSDSGSVTMVNTIVADNDGYGISGEDSDLDQTFCNVWNNASGDYNDVEDATGQDGNVSVDPGFLNPANGDYHLAAGSDLVGAGAPSLQNPDGSPSDIGVYGGPDAESWDLDWDGYGEWWLPGPYDPGTSPGMDCDDQDASVYPGNGCSRG